MLTLEYHADLGKAIPVYADGGIDTWPEGFADYEMGWFSKLFLAQ